MIELNVAFFIQLINFGVLVLVLNLFLFKPIRKAEELLRADEILTAKVAFTPRVARWLKELHPDGREGALGRYIVTLRVADPAWLVREVLQYGVEAEVLEPESLREAVRGAVG